MVSPYGFSLSNALADAENLVTARARNVLALRAMEDEEAIRGARERAIGGDRGALNEIAIIDPSKAVQVQQYLASLDQPERDRIAQNATYMGQMAAYVLSSDDPEMAYQQVLGTMPEDMRSQIPQSFDPDWTRLKLAEASTVDQYLSAIGKISGGGEEQFTLSPGQARFSGSGEMVASLPAADRDTAAEQKIARLEETGLSREQAIAIADGRVGLGQDETGRSVLYDKATGQPIGYTPNPQVIAEIMQEGDALAVHPAALPDGLTPQDIATVQLEDGVYNIPMVVSGMPVSEDEALQLFLSGQTQAIGQYATPEEARAALGEAPQMQPVETPENESASIIPAGVDVAAGLGLEGFGWGTINSIADFLTGNAPYPAQQEAETALSNLRVKTNSALLQGFSGKDNVYTQQMIDGLIVTPRDGQDRAMSKFTQLRSMMQSEMGSLQRDVLSQPENWTPAQVREAQTKYNELSNLTDTYDDMIASLEERRGEGEEIPVVNTDADYEALPSGARFIDPEGNTRRKP